VHTDPREGIAHLLELERLDDRHHDFHDLPQSLVARSQRREACLVNKLRAK
jgi:hypothetical protein